MEEAVGVTDEPGLRGLVLPRRLGLAPLLLAAAAEPSSGMVPPSNSQSAALWRSFAERWSACAHNSGAKPIASKVAI